MHKNLKALWSEKRVMTSVAEFALDLFNKGYELRRNGKTLNSLMEVMAEAKPEELQVKLKAYPNYPAEWTENLQKLARKMFDEGFQNIIIYGPEKVSFTHHNSGAWLEVIYTKQPEVKKWSLANEVETAAEPMSPDGRGRYSLAFWLNQDNALGKQSDDMKPHTKGASTSRKLAIKVKAVENPETVECEMCGKHVKPEDLDEDGNCKQCVDKIENSPHRAKVKLTAGIAEGDTSADLDDFMEFLESKGIKCERQGPLKLKVDGDIEALLAQMAKEMNLKEDEKPSVWSARTASSIALVAPDYKDYLQGVDMRDAQWYDTVIWKPGLCEECGTEQPQVHDQLCMLHHKKHDQDHYNRLEKAILDRQAGLNKEADQLFMQGVTCPHCATKMTPILLVDGIKGVYCSTCRHTDYDPAIKTKVNAGNPSKERTIKLNMKDPGSAVLAE